ncbi:TldD/PmbA family protein [Halochromatium glycolicum]|uniref:Peptidase n=1 Tax=Halochromatium glycolicum TaxID=85075 RepID=A0AAJ0X9U8_9GAMM|nr:metallopeptidase TldD-related protein [Halochromatium glycolicum]MBK1704435.1 peptidase [Halochromatium glycolicum]
MNAEPFFAMAEQVFAHLRGDERLFLSLRSEQSDFVRFNRNRVRQAGALQTQELALTLIEGARQVQASCNLSGDPETDRALILAMLGQLRDRIAHVPDDPYLNISDAPSRSHTELPARLPSVREAVTTLTGLGEGLDLVGIYAAGKIADGLASSLGHRHWHQSTSFNLDWSAYLDSDKAVKDSYSGFDWQPGELDSRLSAQRERLAVMARPVHRIEPGPYRAFLAPAALEELMDLLAWGGFGLRDHRTRQSPLTQLASGERQLHPAVTLLEDNNRGLAPGFIDEGFVKADQVPLITNGRFDTCLADARSAKEYGAEVNAGAEWPESLAMAAGELPSDRVLSTLDTGLYIGNLWYGNWSDRNACRVTGMTRFGTFWVEQGELVAPLAVMRFDDSLYRLLGEQLEQLTRERDLRLSAETYDGRSTASSLLPGILVSSIDLAL